MCRAPSAGAAGLVPEGTWGWGALGWARSCSARSRLGTPADRPGGDASAVPVAADAVREALDSWREGCRWLWKATLLYNS